MSSSRRSSRIATRFPSSSLNEDGDFVPDDHRSESPSSAVSEEMLRELAASGNTAAFRMERNRLSARRSREGFAAKRTQFLEKAQRQAKQLLSLRARVCAMLPTHEVAAIEASAVKEAMLSFVEDVPPTRASGSRTAITDEELRERAMHGDIKAERMLSNRESARMSRKRKWDEWNEVRREALSTEAACRALEVIVSAASSSCMGAECGSVTSDTASVSGEVTPSSPSSVVHQRGTRGLSIVTTSTDDAASSEEDSDSDCASIGAVQEPVVQPPSLVRSTPAFGPTASGDDLLSPCDGVLKGWMLDSGFPVDSAEVDGM